MGVASRLWTRVKAAVGVTDLSVFDSRRNGPGGWQGWRRILEPFTGAWQQNQSWSTDTVLASFAVFACVTRIAQDVSKLRFVLTTFEGGIWKETKNPAYSPVLRQPNSYQNHIQFKETWILSKLIYGNAYILKQRDARGVVVALLPLSPYRVLPLVTASGDVYYRLMGDVLSSIGEQGVTVPASEVIHDRTNCLFHPLVGISPIYAAGCAADQALTIQRNSASFFRNGSTPGGLLIAPDEISAENAAELKAYWMKNYTGENAGNIAILGDNLKYEPLRQTALDSQLVEQLQLTAKIVCACFHVPPYKVGIADEQNGQKNVEALGIQYYEECLQIHIESMEACLDDGLSLDTTTYGIMLDTENLSRMDTTAKAEAVSKLTGAGVMKPNEARAKFNLGPVPGGDTPYLQVQNYSLAALAGRDALGPPTSSMAPAPPPAPAASDASGDEPPSGQDAAAVADQAAEEAMKSLMHMFTKRLECPAI